ncbi:hypothetical protein EPUS_01736 [Endocarpon pusillum Z07020]|uniref:protein-ribulosamine 3-kinase n=1 Tax=Endocarpon pusillum (strain Z07020 / HMAS-L-300199) TaxID=1263415 RepID=U1GJ11_ENDPU|nr:uncharacterized protein EPUS_01736 [Endocarpon pusillum Z07020]ERF71821.1 hypothetical protein EPUS_01736 [Endocarpon pusillum Z07020]
MRTDIDASFTPAQIPEEDKAPTAEVDPVVRAALPRGSTVKIVTTHGASFWAIAKKVEVALPDGSDKSYFLKIYSSDVGKRMAEAEFEGTAAVHAALPRNTSGAIGWGTYESDPNKHFLLLDFHDIEDEMPHTSELVSVIAKLHQETLSPNGKFGFHVGIYGGCQPIDTSWTDTWEEFFTRTFQNSLKGEEAIQGHDYEMTELGEAMINKVIPRLLRPMESGGRKLKPCLLHGDLWHGNVGIDLATDEPMLYDFSSLQTPRKLITGLTVVEMHPWRATRYRINRTHQKAYRRLVEPSAPEEDHDDRNALYGVFNDLTVSSNWSANKQTREL